MPYTRTYKLQRVSDGKYYGDEYERDGFTSDPTRAEPMDVKMANGFIKLYRKRGVMLVKTLGNFAWHPTHGMVPDWCYNLWRKLNEEVDITRPA